MDAYVAGVADFDFEKGTPGGQVKAYFYDSKKKKAVIVQDETDGYSSIYDCFPKYEKNKFEMGTPEKLNDLMYFLREQYPNVHPPILANIKDGTLLHHAVMTNDIEKVRYLIEMGARLDLKALYQVKPSESDACYNFTPIELAIFLKLDTIVDLIQKQTEQKTPVDLKLINQKNAPHVRPQEDESEHSTKIESKSNVRLSWWGALFKACCSNDSAIADSTLSKKSPFNSQSKKKT